MKTRSDSVTQNTVLLQVRLPRELRDEFMRAVKAHDDNASRLVRQWARDYLLKNAQPDLFSSDE